MASDDTSDDIEPIGEFRERAVAFVRANLAPSDPERPGHLTMGEAKALQATIFDAGFAGIAVPTRYGGAGLTLAHQKAWAEAVDGHVVPSNLFVSMGMLGITLLEQGSEVLKARHLPRILRGDEVWIQLLSEPSGGSDMAGAMTRATRDGDTWVVNGAKTWSTGAADADYGMCLARTDWDQPKHQGLSMFAVPLGDPRVTIQPIVGMEGGPAHFFSEYFDDVVLPLENLIGEENQGWSVAHTLLFHERNATAGIGYGLGLGGGHGSSGGAGGTGVEHLVRYAQAAGTLKDGTTRQLIAEAFVIQRSATHVGTRVNLGMRLGALKGDWGSLLKLGLGMDTLRRGEIGLEIAGPDGVIWPDGTPGTPGGAGSGGSGGRIGDAGGAGRTWLGARNISIAGGTNEMQRNIVSERLLGMPREPATDRDQPFSEVVRRRHG